MKLFNYWAYGLRVASEIEFPELYAKFENEIPDLSIQLCDIELLKEHIDENVAYSFKSKENTFHVHVKSVAFYEISNGSNMIIYPYPGAQISDVRAYCLSNAFAAVLHQRKILPLHAGAIINENNLSLIMGDTGSGKSTLLFHLLQKGFKVFSDDVVVISGAGDNHIMEATSSYPMMKLWKHQMEHMGINAMPQVRTGVNKFPFLFHENFETGSRKIDKIIILRVVSGITSCVIRKLKGVETAVLLFNQVYRKEYLNKAEYISSFSFLSTIANNIPCYEISRPLLQSTEIELLNLFTAI